MLHKKKCKTVGCKGLTFNPSGYCDQCQARYKRKAEANRSKDTDRQLIHTKGYNTTEWKTFARKFLLLHPVCAICGAPAEVCDHKVITARQMIDAYGYFILDESLYQPLCRSCNNKKARQDSASDDQYFKDKEGISQLNTTDSGCLLV